MKLLEYMYIYYIYDANARYFPKVYLYYKETTYHY